MIDKTQTTVEWPEDGKPVDFSQLVDPICDAIRFAYRLERQNDGRDIPYAGLEIGREERATCLLAQHQLSAKMLEWSDDDQGRDPLTEIVSLAMRLGIEQGRRVTRDSSEFHILQTLADITRMGTKAMIEATTAEGWPERSPEEAALNQEARELLASIERTKAWLDKMKDQIARDK